MRGIILVYVFMAVILTPSVYAGEWPSADRIVTKIQIELNLGDEQLDKVKQIIEENMAQRQEVTPQMAEGLTQTQSQPFDAELYQKLSGVLTRSQMNQWNKMLTIIREDMDEKSGGR